MQKHLHLSNSSVRHATSQKKNSLVDLKCDGLKVDGILKHRGIPIQFLHFNNFGFAFIKTQIYCSNSNIIEKIQADDVLGE